MKFYRVGDRSAGICEGCHARVVTRMEYRDYTPLDGDAPVPEVLVAACERCGHVVGIPHQSTPRINEHGKTGFVPEPHVSIEARVSREIDEALDLVAMSLGASPRAIRPAMMRYYFAQLVKKPEVAEAVRMRSVVAVQGPANRRIVVKLSASQLVQVTRASRSAGLGSKSELIRGVAVLAAEDCRITLADTTIAADKASKARRAFLKQLAGTM